MLKTFCTIAWDAPLALLIFLFLLAGAAFSIGALFSRGEFRRTALKTGLALCALSMSALVGMNWFSAKTRCRVGRVVREQISHEYVSGHFACDADNRTLRGVSRDVAENALAQCDEDRWQTIAELRSDNVVHEVLRCRIRSGPELWADHFQRWNGLRDWDVCFTACRPGKCSPLTIVTHSTE